MTAPATVMDAARIAAIRQRVPRAFARPLGERLWIWSCWLGLALLTGLLPLAVRILAAEIVGRDA